MNDVSEDYGCECLCSTVVPVSARRDGLCGRRAHLLESRLIDIAENIAEIVKNLVAALRPRLGAPARSVG
jgi:hypothetical protein